jgi:hypothetical protein
MKAQWGSRFIAVPFSNLGAKWGRVINAKPRPLDHQERGPVPPRASLDGCGNYRLHRDSIYGPSNQ